MAKDRERANAAQLAAAEKLGNQAASLEARLRVVSNERKLALEQVSFLEAKVESSANKFSDDLRRATYDAKKALADSYLDVLVSLKEKWEKKKAATDCEARLREVMTNIDLFKEIMNNNLLASDELLRLRTKEDLPEDFFARDSSAANGADDVTKRSGEFAAPEDLIKVLVFGQLVLLDVLKAREVACPGALLASFDSLDSFRGWKFQALATHKVAEGPYDTIGFDCGLECDVKTNKERSV
ncbi:hypothetical protein F2Q70_00036206 [Brassica cretica]|uniref:Uncharacterized protein n=1 Tax=Brassica cretica TaxID=69181 RepID=A0A8S9JWL9_BRACR|nr:hypothetical protein F2Q70_00036206 [Brassica cretica]